MNAARAQGTSVRRLLERSLRDVALQEPESAASVDVIASLAWLPIAGIDPGLFFTFWS